MINFDVLNKETAPQASVAALAGAEKAYGFIPNLLGVFADSPPTLKAYLALGELLGETTLSDTERQLLLLSVSRFNDCEYCVAAHTTVASMQNVPRDVVESIRNDEPIANPKLQTLREFAVAMVEKRGWISDEHVQRFLAAGYTKANILDVILALSFKTLSNYTNHVAETPLDAAFSANVWSSSNTTAA